MEPVDPPPQDVMRLARLGVRARAVVEGLARQPSLVGDRDATIAATLQVQQPDVAAVTGQLAAWGWLRSNPGGTSERRLTVQPDVLVGLGQRLRGILDAQQALERSSSATPIITLPETSLALRRALGTETGCYETRDGFAHVAARARHRLVFLMPFMDSAGADALCQMLEASGATERIVVVRPDSRLNRHYERFLPQMAAAGARVLEYWLARDEPGDGPAAETFHAKVVLADDEVVYVGSSNLLASSLDGGLECGVLLEGDAARPFLQIVEAVVAVSRPVRSGADAMVR